MYKQIQHFNIHTCIPSHYSLVDSQLRQHQDFIVIIAKWPWSGLRSSWKQEIQAVDMQAKIPVSRGRSDQCIKSVFNPQCVTSRDVHVGIRVQINGTGVVASNSCMWFLCKSSFVSHNTESLLADGLTSGHCCTRELMGLRPWDHMFSICSHLLLHKHNSFFCLNVSSHLCVYI